MRSFREVLEEQLQDPEFAAEWDRTEFAREVAIRVVKYRTEHEMTQRDLAKATGLTQPAIGRLEAGEHTPSLGTLAKLSKATGLTFHVDVSGGNVGLKAA
jgi:transcriptional regulator with XRE-family HTH domain